MAEVTPALASAEYKAEIRVINPISADFILQKNGANVEAIRNSDGLIVITNADLSVVLQTIAANDQHIHIKTGNYNMDTQCTLTGISSLVISGDGRSTRLQQTYVTTAETDTWEDGFRLETCNGVQLKDFYINGNGSAGFQAGPSPLSDNVGSCIHAQHCTNILIESCEITDGFFHGIFSTGISDNIVTNKCELHANGYRAVHYHGTDPWLQTTSSVINSHVHNNGANVNSGTNTGIFLGLVNTNDFVVSGNLIENEGQGGNTGFGINVDGYAASDVIAARRTIVESNTITGCYIGIVLTNNPVEVILTGNMISGCARNGIFIREATSISVVGGLITNCGDSGVAFDSAGTSRAVSFSGVTITNCRGIPSATGGILAFGMDGFTISNCVLIDNFDKSTGAGHQLRISNGDPCINGVISGNTIKAGVLRSVIAGDLTSAGTVATLKLKEHGYLSGDSITIAGANETNYNGTVTIDTIVDPDRLTYTIASTTSPATGTITAQTLCNGSGILTHQVATDIVFNGNRINVINGTNMSIDSANSTISNNVCSRALNLTAAADDCIVSGNRSLTATSSIAGSNCLITGNRWSGTLNLTGDNNQLVNNRLDGALNVSGNTNDLAYNNKVSVDTGTGNEEVRTGWT